MQRIRLETILDQKTVEELVRKHFRSEARDATNNVLATLRWIRNAVEELQFNYCNLKRLDAADAIDISEFLSDENIKLIESLLDTFGLKCSIEW